MKYDMDSIYKDFFGENYNKDVKNELKEDEEVEIDSIYVDDESKNMLRRIIDYIKSGKNHINFNICYIGKNQENISKICNIIRKYAYEKNYISKNNCLKYSLYDLKNEDDIRSVFDGSIINIVDVKALDMYDDKFKKIFIYNFKECLRSNICILSGSKIDIDNFFINDDEVKNNYFKIIIKEVIPSIVDIVEDIGEVDDSLKVKLYDYVTSEYSKVDDYITFRDSTKEYIAFNGDVPEVSKNKNIDEVFKELDELVGLEKVKKSLRDLASLNNLKDKIGDKVKIGNVNLHMVFLGNPGTGKTTVARMVANILYDMGYIKTNKLVEVSSKDLVAEFVGQTGPKTMSVVEKAMGGVLFIDEAYSLSTKNNENSYNGEAIATLIKAMEDYRDNLVVIFAGYTKEMKDFLDSNSGIVSRIGYTMEFDDYTKEELVKIFNGMIKKNGFIIDEESISKLENIIDENINMPNFGNARFIRNVYEKTIIKHAENMKNIKNKKKLITISKDDICL